MKKEKIVKKKFSAIIGAGSVLKGIGLFLSEKEKAYKGGLIFLGCLFTISLCLILVFERLSFQGLSSLEKRSSLKGEEEPLSIPFGLKQSKLEFPSPNIEREVAFSSDLPRPGREFSNASSLLVRLKKSGQSKKITTPSRIDLSYEKGLVFSEKESPFWVEIDQMSCAHVFVEVCGETKEVQMFPAIPEKAPFRSAEELQEGSPLHFLASASLLGKDLFLSKYGGGQKLARIEISGSPLLLKEGDFLAFTNGKWGKTESIESDAWIARVSSFSEKTLEIDAWGLDEYCRLCISSKGSSSLKIKPDEVLTSVRIRSEKQISCLLEKQPFVLKVGDYCLKQEGRWRVLRKAEERDAYASGDLLGELFVFDRIDQKGGQKVLHGSFFDTGRAEMVPIEFVTSSLKKGGKGKK